jgi:hypothetical protein
MKEDYEKENEALAALLNKVELPKAPAWFEARTLARLRRENDRERFHVFKVLRYVLVGACASLVTFIIIQHAYLEQPLATPLAKQETQDEQLYAALDAFVSYTQQAKEWNQEAY